MRGLHGLSVNRLGSGTMLFNVGVWNTSALARISQPVAAERERMRSNLVFPIKPSTPSTMSSFDSSSSGDARDGVEGRERGVRRYVVVAPNAIPSERRRSGRGREVKDMGKELLISTRISG